ncbi:RusA family crossover junction endodeoxyribonuclease [Rhodococcus zopfii]|uniref:RusA family crossover junction endodeoxyribonuclease n=1 Tax=Rhodococcus zopfii TaxID=43772 RepID=A0ABU3WKQ1_9NOCA|nr:RusA family crossover junction endodeoxyribonuclease [Rhodococcus zopfii]
MITFFVAGHAGPQGSKSYKGHRNGKPVLLESSKRVAPWRQAVVAEAVRHADGLLAGPVGVRVQFILPRPKTAPARSVVSAARRIGDLDKLCRSTLDALSDVIYRDDAQVVDLRASKRVALPGETPGAHITITTATEGGLT